MEFKYTKHQVARGTRPDFESGDKVYLIKNVSSTLRSTYQIRLLIYFAVAKNLKLIIRVPKSCKVANTLKDIIDENKKHVKVERM